MNFQIFKLVLEKPEEQEIKLPTSAGSLKRQKSSRKTSISALLTMPKPLTVQITINHGKFWKRWEYQTTWPSWEICMQVRKQQLKLTWTTDWFQIGKGVCQGCILTHGFLNLYAEYLMRNAGWEEAQAESRLPGEISITSDMRWHHTYGRKWRRTKNLLMKVKEESEKVDLKLNMKNTKIMASSPISSVQFSHSVMSNSVTPWTAAC